MKATGFVSLLAAVSLLLSLFQTPVFSRTWADGTDRSPLSRRSLRTDPSAQTVYHPEPLALGLDEVGDWGPTRFICSTTDSQYTYAGAVRGFVVLETIGDRNVEIQKVGEVLFDSDL